ncbi:unnamed protein product [Rangifer tarandus platyrhynchus]|uniref:Uncharacterized protein n=1 Tax=Rangifer tarandus platyrhynchus TaxID=3082113 RepID=A0ABN8Z769_RANTA|nr:unnamed protein product [Rangifer tarandus platyrhynchus]
MPRSPPRIGDTTGAWELHPDPASLHYVCDGEVRWGKRRGKKGTENGACGPLTGCSSQPSITPPGPVCAGGQQPHGRHSQHVPP